MVHIKVFHYMPLLFLYLDINHIDWESVNQTTVGLPGTFIFITDQYAKIIILPTFWKWVSILPALTFLSGIYQHVDLNISLKSPVVFSRSSKLFQFNLVLLVNFPIDFIITLQKAGKSEFLKIINFLSEIYLQATFF